jgi:hypothetical protein
VYQSIYCDDIKLIEHLFYSCQAAARITRQGLSIAGKTGINSTSDAQLTPVALLSNSSFG